MHGVVGDILAELIPNVAPDFACLFYTAAAIGVLGGSGARFAAGGAYPPSAAGNLFGGWGVKVFPTRGEYWIEASTAVDPEDGGSFCGHAWVDLGGGVVFDLQEKYVGPAVVVSGDTTVVYHRTPKLERSILRFHRAQLKAVRIEAAKVWGARAR
jgi:hypothetical protein